MHQKIKTTVTSIVPTIGVTDLMEASDFYAQLGFDRDWLWPESDPTHASFSNNGCSFMVVKVDGIERIQKADLYFRINTTTEMHTHLTQQTEIQVSELIKSPYGMLDFSVTDPWGHHLTFGEPSGEYQES